MLSLTPTLVFPSSGLLDGNRSTTLSETHPGDEIEESEIQVCCVATD